ncbi:hypothetical protein Q8F55_002204 [Vanrija albida]|uniref:Uncharacterized protein n=1 Tax=Vanrija albida TaxID=181172 RepID=A0ABR3Q9A0_9TREE
MAAFILAPAPAPPPAQLHLLPFSLPPSTSSATISTYFQPRPAPAGHPAQGRRLATFRGRQVVGQEVRVPPGYRGVVLRATGSTDSTTPADDSTADEAAARPRYPLTPASSVESTSTSAGRTRGAGQVALARPRRRAAVTRARIALDEEESDDDDVVKPLAKRARARTPERGPVPEINVVHATPAKGEAAAEVEDDAEAEASGGALAPAPAAVQTEDVAPAPAQQEYAADGRPARVLAPVGSFEGFTLWTPDAPLAGYGGGEGENGAEVKEEGAEAEGDKPAEGEGAAQLARGWWSPAGAGEGGDEFVRALGEWLGLCEIIHTPVYLDDGDDTDDDE